ncbi:MAG: glycerophosphoryl diester phosphodiesterase [Blastococcus sp.]|jgi:glycerophosphoryl diester phosphodiesterase|nr:glycerophosphoryl diester phosphodiesterase [Blastococcus sp.]
MRPQRRHAPLAARPLLSAHRGGAGDDPGRENTRDALVDAVLLECEYVEIDVQRCRGGAHVVHHDDVVMDGDRQVPLSTLTLEEFTELAGPCLLLDEALEVLRGRKKVHLDLKFLSDPGDGGDVGHGHEVELVEHVIEAMGAENVVVTTLEDESVAAIRGWSRSRHPDLLVGLSLGRDVEGPLRWSSLTNLYSELFPARRVRSCDANLVVCNKTIALLRVAGWAARRRLPLLVWTVDEPRELRAWLRDPRAWLITTNFPRRAARLRRELGGAPRDADGAPSP